MMDLRASSAVFITFFVHSLFLLKTFSNKMSGANVRQLSPIVARCLSVSEQRRTPGIVLPRSADYVRDTISSASVLLPPRRCWFTCVFRHVQNTLSRGRFCPREKTRPPDLDFQIGPARFCPPMALLKINTSIVLWEICQPNCSQKNLTFYLEANVFFSLSEGSPIFRTKFA